MTTENKDVVITPRARALGEIQRNLTDLLNKNMKAFPKGFNETRFLQNCMTVLMDTKDIEKCTPMSVARTLIKGAYLGLDFFRRECYGIPYGTEMNFQTDYKGEIKLVKKYSPQPIQDIYAQVVRKGEVLDIRIEAGKQVLNFTPDVFSNEEIVGVFAVVYFLDGSMRYETMSKEQVEDVRKKFSKAPNSPAWRDSWPEMAKKAVLRRLCKMLALDFDNAEQEKAFEEGADTEVRAIKPKGPAPQIHQPFPQDAQQGTAPAEDAQVVDPDAALKEEIRKEHGDWNEWQVSDEVTKRKAAAKQ